MALSQEELARRPLDLHEVADFLRISHRSVQRLIASGELPAKRVGGVWRVTIGALEAYLANPDNAPEAPLPETEDALQEEKALPLQEQKDSVN